MAFDSLEPVGELRADVRAGLVAATVANVHRGRGQRAFTPGDFMPFSHRARPADVGTEMRKFFSQHRKGAS